MAHCDRSEPSGVPGENASGVERTRPTVNGVLGPGGLAEAAHGAWESRASQLEMAGAVWGCFARGGVLAIEAPTGVGKTMAYLVPAILSGKRVIVSTNTKTLQDQIVDKDIPLLRGILERAGMRLVRAEPGDMGPPDPGEVRYALMKGRSNYLCLDRLDRKRRQTALRFAGDGDRLEDLAAWSERTASGDRAELRELPEGDPLWPELDARAEICTGRACARFDECFVVKMRQAAQNADIVVVNHHLLLADLALRAETAMASEDGRSFGVLIPRADVLVIDEAHALEESAAEHFGGQVSTQKLARLVRDVAAWLETSPDAASIGSALGEAERAVMRVFDALRVADGARLRLRPSDQPEVEAARLLAPYAQGALLALGQSLEGANDLLGDALARRAQSIAENLRFVLDAGDLDFVYWAERRARAASVGAAPIEVGQLLSTWLFSEFTSVVLTSATLGTGGEEGLEFFLERVGAPPGTAPHVLTTPFDYASQAALYVPPDLPEPADPRFLDALCEEAEQLVHLTGGGAFLLFTSHRMMKAAHDRLGRRLPYPVFLQGDAPKADLLRSFVSRAPAVLFATASFWEGVDVPGDPLRLVIIDKLPFAAPADPIVEARAQRIESKGGDPFSEYQVPQAILRLKQGFGRLVRTRSDRGIVAIMDRRLRTKSYGRRFLEALPGAARIYDREDLSAWLHVGAGGQ